MLGIRNTQPALQNVCLYGCFALLVLHTGRGAKVQVDGGREIQYFRKYYISEKKQFDL